MLSSPPSFGRPRRPAGPRWENPPRRANLLLHAATCRGHAVGAAAGEPADRHGGWTLHRRVQYPGTVLRAAEPLSASGSAAVPGENQGDDAAWATLRVRVRPRG